MRSIISWMLRRFLRMGLWIPGLLLPLAIFAWMAIGLPEIEPAATTLLDYLLYALPALAAIAIITSVDRSTWSLILTRPIGFPRLFLGIWLGGLIPPLFCHAAIVLAGAAGAALHGGGAGGAECYPRMSWQRGLPGAPVAAPQAGSDSRAARIAWLEMENPWTIRVEGIEAGRPLSCSLCAAVADVDREGEGASKLYPGKGEARISYPREDGTYRSPPQSLSLKDLRPARWTVPAEAVDGAGNLTVVVALQREAGSSSPVLWFGDLNRRFEVQRDDNFNPLTGLLVEKNRIGFGGNFLRCGILAAGLLPLVAGLAAFSAMAFGHAVAFVFSLTIFLSGSALMFLRDAVGILSLESAALLLGDPSHHAILRKPDWFTQLLDQMARFWLAVLPDFRYFRGGGFLAAGEAVDWWSIGRGHAIGLGYALAFFFLAALASSKREDW